jgi:hypothetical protein
MAGAITRFDYVNSVGARYLAGMQNGPLEKIFSTENQLKIPNCGNSKKITTIVIMPFARTFGPHKGPALN